MFAQMFVAFLIGVFVGWFFTCVYVINKDDEERDELTLDWS